MPKETPRIAGTIMNTSNRVNHTVKEIPSRIHNKLSKGLKKSSMLKSGGDKLNEKLWNQRAGGYTTSPGQKWPFMKITTGGAFFLNWTWNTWPTWRRPHGQCRGLSYLLQQSALKRLSEMPTNWDEMAGPRCRCPLLSQHNLLLVQVM